MSTSASSSGASAISNSQAYNNYKNIRFRLIPHVLITFLHITLSTLCLFYLPHGHLFDDPLESLNVTIKLLFIEQILCETIRWFAYLEYEEKIGRDQTNNGFTAKIVNLIKTRSAYIFMAVILTFFGACCYHIVAIFFGAPMIDDVLYTWLFGLYMSLLTTFPSASTLKNHKSLWIKVFPDYSPESIPEIMIFYSTFSTIIGAWLSGSVIVLDWDRPWQKWPIPCVIGGYLEPILTDVGLPTVEYCACPEMKINNNNKG
nr:12801_t:CDS:2 [Entrophospora candida]